MALGLRDCDDHGIRRRPVSRVAAKYRELGQLQARDSSTITLPAGRSTLRIAAGYPVQAFNLAGILVTRSLRHRHPPPQNPLFGMKFFVNPYSEAAQNTWQGCNNGQSIGKIAAQPQSTWFGNWNYNPAGDVATVLQSAAATGSVPILTVYDIVNRDCGGYSSGGAANAGAYQGWIQAFASGIGNNRAVILLEPDSLTQYNTQGCLNQPQQAERISLLQYAISTLKQKAPNAVVYLDGGPPNGIDPTLMAQALVSAGVSQIAGFAVNISNYESTQNDIAYGNQISQLTGGKHYVIDTSRNGVGATPITSGATRKIVVWDFPRRVWPPACWMVICGFRTRVPPTVHATADRLPVSSQSRLRARCCRTAPSSRARLAAAMPKVEALSRRWCITG